MKIPLSQAKSMLYDVLKTSGGDEKDIQTMIEMRLEYDFHRNTFSGFEGLEGVIKELNSSKGKSHSVVVDKPAMKLLDGNGRSAKLIGMEICDLISEMAKTNGIALVGLHNATYHGILETYSRKIASQDLIAIVSANGGPQGVVPFNGSKDIFGTNPVSYGIPSNDLPIVFDAATAKYAYGSIALAKERGIALPDNSYLTKDGVYTTDPNLAIAIVPFGEHKGYAINLLLEVLTGSFVRAKMGLEQHKKSELGSFFIAIDPSAFMPLADFKTSVSELMTAIEQVPTVAEDLTVKVPGITGEKAKQEMLRNGEIEIDNLAWQEFEKLHKRVTM